MSWGESKTSKNGGVSGFLGLLRRVSGEVAAREARRDRKGSLGLIGGMGILALLITLKLRRLGGCTTEAEEEQQREEAMGIRRQLAIQIYAFRRRKLSTLSTQFANIKPSRLSSEF